MRGRRGFSSTRGDVDDVGGKGLVAPSVLSSCEAALGSMVAVDLAWMAAALSVARRRGEDLGEGVGEGDEDGDNDSEDDDGGRPGSAADGCIAPRS